MLIWIGIQAFFNGSSKAVLRLRICIHFVCFKLRSFFHFLALKEEAFDKICVVLLFQARRSQVLPNTLYRYQVLHQLNQLQLLRLQPPPPPHVASLQGREQSSMLLTLPAKQPLSAPRDALTASRQTQVRIRTTVSLIYFTFKHILKWKWLPSIIFKVMTIYKCINWDIIKNSSQVLLHCLFYLQGQHLRCSNANEVKSVFLPLGDESNNYSLSVLVTVKNEYEEATTMVSTQVCHLMWSDKLKLAKQAVHVKDF